MMSILITKISDQTHCHSFAHTHTLGLNAVLTRPKAVYREPKTMSGKAPPGHFTVLYFAGAGTYTGRESEALPAPLTLRGLFAALEARYPGVRGAVLASCMVTVNLEYVDVPEAEGEEGVTLVEGDEVAIIPPVSSG